MIKVKNKIIFLICLMLLAINVGVLAGPDEINNKLIRGIKSYNLCQVELDSASSEDCDFEGDGFAEKLFSGESVEGESRDFEEKNEMLLESITDLEKFYEPIIKDMVRLCSDESFVDESNILNVLIEKRLFVLLGAILIQPKAFNLTRNDLKKLCIFGVEGLSPIYVALIRDYKFVFRLMVERGADVNKEYCCAEKAVEYGAECSCDDGILLNGVLYRYVKLLHLAAAKGDCDLIRLLYEKGARIEARDFNSDSPLHVAVECDNFAAVKVLVELGAMVDALNSRSRTPLHLAAATGKLKIIKILIADGADPCSRDLHGNAPLHLAVKSGVSESVTAILESVETSVVKEAVNMRDMCGDTPFHLAVIRSDFKMIRVFIDNGVDINAQNSEGMTALHLAALGGNFYVVMFLLRMGADAYIVNDVGEVPQDLAIRNIGIDLAILITKRGIHVMDIKAEKDSLHKAVEQGDYEETKRLLDGAVYEDVCAVNFHGDTPFHLAVESGNIEVARLIAKHFVKVDLPEYVKLDRLFLPVNEGNSFGCTALHVAASEKKVPAKMLEFLIDDCNAEMDILDAGNSTPLHVAVRKGEFNKVEVLLKSGAKVNVQDRYGKTALHWANIVGDPKIIELLKANGADCSIKDDMGRVPEEMEKLGVEDSSSYDWSSSEGESEEASDEDSSAEERDDEKSKDKDGVAKGSKSEEASDDDSSVEESEDKKSNDKDGGSEESGSNGDLGNIDSLNDGFVTDTLDVRSNNKVKSEVVSLFDCLDVDSSEIKLSELLSKILTLVQGNGDPDEDRSLTELIAELESLIESSELVEFEKKVRAILFMLREMASNSSSVRSLRVDHDLINLDHMDLEYDHSILDGHIIDMKLKSDIWNLNNRLFDAQINQGSFLPHIPFANHGLLVALQ